MAQVRLSSRFDILHVMDECADFDDSDDDGSKQTVRKSNKNSGDPKEVSKSGDDGMSANAKKRAKKKKKQQQQQAAELRNIAFKKLPTSVSKKPLVGNPTTCPVTRLPPGLSPVQETVPPANSLQSPVSNPMQWEQWKSKDSGYVQDQFQDDLHEALLASKVEFEKQRDFIQEVGEVALTEDKSSPPGINRKERRKHLQGGRDKPQAMTLHDFQAMPPSNDGVETIEIPKKPEPDPEFFNKVDKDVDEIISKEERNKLRKHNLKLASENARRVQYEDNLDKRDEEIAQFKTTMEKMKEELGQVKKRNKQLCVILAQGEMKDKADVIQQVIELSAVKDELTTEVTELHISLEQERSKVSSLKAELQRLQEKRK